MIMQCMFDVAHRATTLHILAGTRTCSWPEGISALLLFFLLRLFTSLCKNKSGMLGHLTLEAGYAASSWSTGPARGQNAMRSRKPCLRLACANSKR